MIISRQELQDWPTFERNPNQWEYAKPIASQGLSLKRKLKSAWAVLTGKCFAVRWY